MWHFTVPLDLTFVSWFATDSDLLLRLFSPFLCQYLTPLLSFWCLNDDLLSQQSSTLKIFLLSLVVNGRPGLWAFCALSLPSQHPLGHLNPRTLDRTSSPCAPRSKLKVWLEVFLNFTHINIHVYSVLFFIKYDCGMLQPLCKKKKKIELTLYQWMGASFLTQMREGSSVGNMALYLPCSSKVTAAAHSLVI